MNPTMQEAMQEMYNQHGIAIAELSKSQPVMLVFLRKFGCIFCEESMKDISARRAIIENRGVRIVLVHMADNDIAEQYFKRKNLLGIDHVSDPECVFYDRFGLIKGKFNQLYGLQVWLRTAEIAIKDRTMLRQKHIGDGLQMPGVFLIREGEIIERYIHARSSDRPDYDALSACCKTV